MTDTDSMRVADKVRATDNVRIEQYDIAAIRAGYPGWDDLPKRVRHVWVKRCTEPVHVGRVSNVTCVALHEYVTRAMTFAERDAGSLDPPRELAWGDDDTSFATTDTELNNEVGERTPITDPSATDTTFNIDEYLSSNEQNGNTLREVGIFSESGDLWQHSATDQVYNKDNTFALVINISIPIGDAGA